MRNSRELQKSRELTSEEGLDGLMGTINEVNPRRKKKARPEKEETILDEIRFLEKARY